MQNNYGYLWQKIRAAELAGITHYVNDEVGLKELFKRFLPKVATLSPFDRQQCTEEQPLGMHLSIGR